MYSARVLVPLITLFAFALPGHALAKSPTVPPRATTAQTDALGPYVLLSWNDLGMHCMNQMHANLSVLPPYNNLDAQLILRGDAGHLPQLVTTSVTVGYSFPGNTYSVGKTDFWTWSNTLFGVTLPPNVGLTGLGLSGTMTLTGPRFRAEGIPLTPFQDAAPTVETPYQHALVIARDTLGNELARSTPVAPVSVELSCVSAGCHASETAILNGHEPVAGFSPTGTPILCGKCHADPALGTTGRQDAGYFSFRMHDAHSFMDQQFTGVDLCYKCHPGRVARCLRGVMATSFGLVCQDCHGGMVSMATGIENGRVPWVQEPACRTCHTARFGEPIGQLYRHTTGHGGVMCEGCHNSTHSEWPSGQAADDANILALQTVAGPLSDCRVCHGALPTSPGPHDINPTSVEGEILAKAMPLRAWPNPMRSRCYLEMGGERTEGGRLLIFDLQGRTLRLLRPQSTGDGVLRAAWDGCDQYGRRVRPGTYFARWTQGGAKSAARITVTN